MAIAIPGTKATRALTYAEYLGEGETPGRYEIIDGVREWMTNPTQRHQRILLKLIDVFHRFELSERRGFTLVSPVDILIERKPLKTRQPDLSFMSIERFADTDLNDPAPFEIAPELVAEILSPSERSRTLTDKLADYARAGSLECWILDPQSQVVDVCQLAPGIPTQRMRFGTDETFTSLSFHSLVVQVADIVAY